jgi:hypothetical protein
MVLDVIIGPKGVDNGLGTKGATVNRGFPPVPGNAPPPGEGGILPLIAPPVMNNGPGLVVLEGLFVINGPGESLSSCVIDADGINAPGLEILPASMGPPGTANGDGPSLSICIGTPAGSKTGGPEEASLAAMIGDGRPARTGGPPGRPTDPPVHKIGGPPGTSTDPPEVMTGGPVRYFNALYGP